MDAAQLLGYDESPNFLRAEEDFSGSQELAYVLRKARAECSLKGVYVLRPEGDSTSPIPVVYFCQADSEAVAQRIHRQVWNQGIVPFILVQTPKYLKLYSGFLYTPPSPSETEANGTLNAAIAFNDVLDQLPAFQAQSIDDGTLWKEWGDLITPETRVDWSLLENLRNLDAYLREQGVSKEISHALIGKFVYFHYLRDRNILSDRKLAKWHIDPHSVFSRHATLDSFLWLDTCTHDWLNGSIFPLDPHDLPGLASYLFQLVAGVFAGDTVEGQLHLNFQPYDFSFIPIETLSVIYEQFLHLPETGRATTRGRESGAYYTPIPLIAFMQEELERKRPLAKGMTILDSACGSGAFLVQCYRRLIEKRRQEQRLLRPRELRDMLTSQLFGVERDGDACRVAELSLILTLLDCVNPPDLENNPAFQLPRLRNTNIFEADFFAPDSVWAKTAATKKFDWIIGNPPWISLSSQRLREEDRHVWQWMENHAQEAPTGGNQVAEAFAWKTLSYLKPAGVAGLVLPAMTLFKNLPVPLDKLSQTEINEWAELRDTLAEMSQAVLTPRLGGKLDGHDEQNLAEKIGELNDRVYQLLGLREADRILVQDFVTITMQCIKGKVTKEVFHAPSKSTMQLYLQRLKHELDAFIDSDLEKQHEIIARHDTRSAMLAIRLTQTSARQSPLIRAANEETSYEFARIHERLKKRHSQWMYFNRNLRIYDHDILYCFKPMQALHWTQRQAILDAGEVIAETLLAEA